VEHSNKLPLVNRILTAPLLVILSVLVFVPATFGQQPQTEGGRKIVRRATPDYPEMAWTLNLSGSVKAEAVVQPNGEVKSVNITGGHPVLVRAAREAIYHWKWAPSTHETRELVEIKFNRP
jgi:TonB family protein